jgi:hypothetical protein
MCEGIGTGEQNNVEGGVSRHAISGPEASKLRNRLQRELEKRDGSESPQDTLAALAGNNNNSDTSEYIPSAAPPDASSVRSTEKKYSLGHRSAEVVVETFSFLLSIPSKVRSMVHKFWK